MAHTILVAFTIFAGSSLTSLAQAATSDLVGCWHGIRAVQYVADGSGHEVPGSDCTLAGNDSDADWQWFGVRKMVTRITVAVGKAHAVLPT